MEIAKISYSNALPISLAKLHPKEHIVKPHCGATQFGYASIFGVCHITTIKQNFAYYFYYRHYKVHPKLVICIVTYNGSCNLTFRLLYFSTHFFFQTHSNSYFWYLIAIFSFLGAKKIYISTVICTCLNRDI